MAFGHVLAYFLLSMLSVVLKVPDCVGIYGSMALFDCGCTMIRISLIGGIVDLFCEAIMKDKKQLCTNLMKLKKLSIQVNDF